MAAVRILVLVAFCCNSVAEFLYPGPMGESFDYVHGVPLWELGLNQTLKWKTDFTVYDIALWQQNIANPGGGDFSGPVIYDKNNDDPEIGDSEGLEWTVDIRPFNNDTSNVYFFLLQPDEKGESALFSSYFNVSASEHQSASTSAVTSSTTASSSSSTSSLSSTTPTVPPTPSSSPSQNSTDTTKIALGVGLGLGIPLILLSAVVIWLVSKRMRGKRLTSPKGTPTADVPVLYSGNKPELSAENERKQMQWHTPTELDGTSRATELPASR